MSSRAVAGEEDAREDAPDDDLDLRHDLEAGEEPPGILDDSLDQVGDEIDREGEIPERAEQATRQHNTEAGSLDSSQEGKTQDTGGQQKEDTHSADDTSSVPDDSPSIQVFSVLLFYKPFLTKLRVPFCLPSRAMHNHFCPPTLALTLAPPDDRSIDVSSLAFRHRL
jgi:hypothetical protein